MTKEEIYFKEVKEQVELIFDIHILNELGMDSPSNKDEIIQFIAQDVVETADRPFSYGDVVIGFRRWIEHKSELQP